MPATPLPETVRKVEYPDGDAGLDGVLTHLPAKLSGTLEFDRVSLDGMPRSKRMTLWFRQGAKRIYRISLVRRGGRCLVEMGGLDPHRVVRAVSICRDHLDQWFGITRHDLVQYEARRARKGSVRAGRARMN